jgi:hypothetical protein
MQTRFTQIRTDRTRSSRIRTSGIQSSHPLYSMAPLRWWTTHSPCLDLLWLYYGIVCYYLFLWLCSDGGNLLTGMTCFVSITGFDQDPMSPLRDSIFPDSMFPVSVFSSRGLREAFFKIETSRIFFSFSRKLNCQFFFAILSLFQIWKKQKQKYSVKKSFCLHLKICSLNFAL